MLTEGSPLDGKLWQETCEKNTPKACKWHTYIAGQLSCMAAGFILVKAFGGTQHWRPRASVSNKIYEQNQGQRPVEHSKFDFIR